MSTRQFTPALFQRSESSFGPPEDRPFRAGSSVAWDVLKSLDRGLTEFVERYIAGSHTCALPCFGAYSIAESAYQAPGHREAYVCPECQQVWLKDA